MTRRVRAFLLAGCGLIALLEAPDAGSSLVAGLAGPYARQAEPQAPSSLGAEASLPLDLADTLAPLFATLATSTASGQLRAQRR